LKGLSGDPHTVMGENIMHAREMIRTHPDVQGNMSEALVQCIEACYACAQACTACADACLAEAMVDQLRQCIRLDLDCADVCAATGALASRRTGSNQAILRQMLEVCAAACRACGEECEGHARQHEHCRVCAEACRRCEQACREAMGDVG
jgi:transposase